jgi:kynurenine/2-aminoadipate aminotransferase
MISLGGGLPNPEMFPFTSLSFGLKSPSGPELLLTLSKSELKEALQYSPTAGLPRLCQQLQQLQQLEHGLTIDSTNTSLMVTVGSQDAFCKAIEMLIEPGGEDIVFLEDPTYSGALAFLQPYGAKLVPIEIDQDGLIPSQLQLALESEFPNITTCGQDDDGLRRRRRVLYTIPTAQNPSGATLSPSRRQEIYQLAQRYDLIILEDDPYWFLHPQRRHLSSFLSMDEDGRVLRFDSFSKVISSGLRIGFVTGPSRLVEKLNFHVQATNLHNSGVSQAMLQKVLDTWGMDGFQAHCQEVAEFYTQRRNAMVQAAERHLVGLAQWSIPDAGMFLWIRIPGILDTKTWIEETAAQSNILLVPGQSFWPWDHVSNHVRASFSTASNEEMDIAIQRLATLIRDTQAPI